MAESPKQRAIFWFAIGTFLSLRLWIAVSRLDEIWPDEHFQTVEPASWVVFGRGILSWEWQQHYRSWTVPGLFIPLFWLLKLVGATAGKLPVQLSRAAVALASVWMITRINQLMLRRSISFWIRLSTLTIFGLSVPCLFWTTAPLPDTLAMIAIWGALPSIFNLSEMNSTQSGVKAGLLAGLAFLIKVQTAFWTAGLGLGFLIAKKKPRWLMAFGSGYLACVLTEGWLDKITLGTFFGSARLQLTRGAEIARGFGVSPWYDYFRRVPNNLGLSLCILFLAVVIAAVRRTPSRPSHSTVALTLSSLSFFAVHSMIAHKEDRFLLPLLPAMFYFLALGAQHLLANNIYDFTAFNTRIEKKSQFIIPAFGILIFSGLTMLSLQKIKQTRLPMSYANTSELESVIAADPNFATAKAPCVLLMGQDWTNTRGLLMLGVDGSFRKMQSNGNTEDTPARRGSRSNCTYAIVANNKISAFSNRPNGVRPQDQNWVFLQRAKDSSFSLFKDIPIAPKKL